MNNMKNNKFYEIFPDENAQAEAFKKISEMFYDQNFSSASKAEIELLMFSVYMDATLKHYKRADGTVDYGVITDYEMGKELGIPQEKVRSLKVKKQARYPIEFDWKKSLLSVKDNIRYAKETKKIIIPTRDPNLYNEIRNFIENHGGYIEVQRSGNVIQIRPEYYFMLVYENLDEKGKEKCRKELSEELRKHNAGNDIREAHTAIEVLKHTSLVAKIGINVLCAMQAASGNPLWEILQAVGNSL